MKNVYVLIIEWNRHGDAGHEIFAVCATRDKAREFLADEIDSDLQYGGFDSCEGIPADIDLKEHVSKGLPIESDWVKLSNNPDEDGFSDDYIEYTIMETPLYE